jgi:hypothetical protein
MNKRPGKPGRFLLSRWLSVTPGLRTNADLDPGLAGMTPWFWMDFVA